VIENGAGTQWDPELVALFTQTDAWKADLGRPLSQLAGRAAWWCTGQRGATAGPCGLASPGWRRSAS